MTTPETYADLGEAAWRWVLDQVRWDADGPWIPESVPHDGGPPEERDGMHSGIGGLAHVLAGVGWMQGTAGIAAYLLRLARVVREGRTTPAVARLDTWWNLP